MTTKFPELLAEVVRLAAPEGQTLTPEWVEEHVKPEEVAAHTGDIYEWLAAQGMESDSVAREAVFEFAAASLGLPYDAFYDAWLDERPVVTAKVREQMREFAAQRPAAAQSFAAEFGL